MMDKIITNHEFSRLISVSSSALLRFYASTLLRLSSSCSCSSYSPLPGAKKRRENISLALLVVVSSSSL